MAKKIDNSANQGNLYMQNLLGNREVVPLNTSNQDPQSTQEQNKASETVSSSSSYHSSQPYNHSLQTSPVNQTPSSSYYEQMQPVREKPKENMTRASFTIRPSDFMRLKKIAYIQNKRFSNIICDLVLDYIKLHLDELEQFEKLSSAEKSRANLDR